VSFNLFLFYKFLIIFNSRPTLESDPNCNEKKKYIGNDFATIVYNESGEDYNLNTIKVNI
jgi:tuberous sclerosis protein 2